MSNQTSLIIRLSHDSAVTDNTVVKVELSAATWRAPEPFTLAWYSALIQPKKKKSKSYIERKLRKIGR